MKNKSKYKIMINPPELTDPEMEQYKNFQTVLDKSMLLKKGLLSSYPIIASSVVAVGVSVSAWIYFKPAAQKDAYVKIKKHEISNPATIRQENNAAAIDPLNQTKDSILGTPQVAAIPETKTTPLPEEKKADEPEEKKRTAEKGKSELPQENSFAEAMPPQGYPSLFEFFSRHLVYPEKAKKDGIQGTVMVEFYIAQDGKAEQVEILNSLSPELDTEAKRLILAMPNWQPATIDGKTISVRQTLPITFSLK